VVPGVQVERATVRTTWTPGAASARLCLGQRWSGWKLLHAHSYGPAVAHGAPSIPVSADPPPEAVLTVGALCSDHLMATGLTRVGRASAQPARSAPKAGAQGGAEPGARPAERSAAGA